MKLIKNYFSVFYLLSLVSLAILLIKCDTGSGKEKLVEGLSEAYDNAYNNHQSYALAQDSLKASHQEWEKEHEVFTDEYQPSDSLEVEHQMLQKEHSQLIDQHQEFLQEHEAFLQRIESMKSSINAEAEKVKNEVEKIFAQVEEYMNKHKQMMQKHEQMEEKHNDYLYGQRVDTH